MLYLKYDHDIHICGVGELQCTSLENSLSPRGNDVLSHEYNNNIDEGTTSLNCQRHERRKPPPQTISS